MKYKTSFFFRLYLNRFYKAKKYTQRKDFLVELWNKVTCAYFSVYLLDSVFRFL